MALWRKVGRSTGATCTNLFTVVIFVLLLTFLFVLYQPTSGPGRNIQRIGWQSWDVIKIPSSAQEPLPIDPGSISIGGSEDTITGNTTLPPGVDWWDVENGEDAESSSTLPLDVWAPLLPHDIGLTDLAIARCIVPASLTRVCDPHTTPEEDALKGPWVRVERDLNARDGLWYLYLYYRRSRRLDIPLITDIRLLAAGEEANLEDPGKWSKVTTSIRDGVVGGDSLYLWYKLGPALRDINEVERANLITELDILFGQDRPWYGFEKVAQAVNKGIPAKLDPVWLTFRRGVKIAPKAPPLHFSREGTFKIMQVADLHYSVSQGTCRDTDVSPCRQGDVKTRSLLSTMLDAESPDFVIFTGDQLNGQGTSWDARSVLAKFAGEVTDRKIPWAAIFGNHDDEEDLSRTDQMKLLESMPYSLSSAGPKDVDGIGNYVLKVKSADASKTQLLTLYMLDSHAYTKKRLPGLLGFLEPVEYDYIKQSQIDWFLSESANIKPILRPFIPDGGRDIGPISGRQNMEALQDQRPAKPNALVFFHIPLPETYSKPDTGGNPERKLDFGSQLDLPGASKTNGGFFQKALLKAPESEDGDKEILEVKAVGNGHCHISDNCRRVHGIWMCFGGGGSYSGYGKIGFDRRFRIYNISDYGETIQTYKRTEKDEIVDNMVLAGLGAPV